MDVNEAAQTKVDLIVTECVGQPCTLCAIHGPFCKRKRACAYVCVCVCVSPWVLCAQKMQQG